MKTLYQKLGLKESSRLSLSITRTSYEALCGELPDSCVIVDDWGTADVVHLFMNTEVELSTALQRAEQELSDESILWISWYKGSSKRATELTENRIRTVALCGTLVDVKVCSVNDDWSALKLVRRVEHRGSLPKC